MGTGTFSPSGPKGPRESSRASRRTGWVPGRRGVRGLRPAGDLSACEEDAPWDCFDFKDASTTKIRHVERSRLADLPESCTNPEGSGDLEVLALDGTSA